MEIGFNRIPGLLVLLIRVETVVAIGAVMVGVKACHGGPEESVKSAYADKTGRQREISLPA